MSRAASIVPLRAVCPREPATVLEVLALQAAMAGICHRAWVRIVANLEWLADFSQSLLVSTVGPLFAMLDFLPIDQLATLAERRRLAQFPREVC